MIKLNQKLRDLLGTHGEPPPHLINPPLFISGCMRSGTTLLVNKLSEHPQLFKIGAELNKIWSEIGGASMRGMCEYKSAEDADAYFTYQMSHYFFH